MTSAEPTQNGEPDLRIALAIRLIEDARYDVPTVAQLAAAVELSPDYFLRLFRDATGRTPIEYMRDNRLDQAAFRLGVTTDSVADGAVRLTATCLR